MGAEQSARLACTQTVEYEEPLPMNNSELFFRLHFESMPEPVTGPVTEALYHLVTNMRGAQDGDVSPADDDEDGDTDGSEDSGFSSDSNPTVVSYDDVEIEPIQIAQFESMEEYEVAMPEAIDLNAYPLPNGSI
ncbi:hypothetical protein KR018_011438 [Drosophila ironensis]|nr:hypothetical protein KR018_011438 [Drosophila ironensis]